ncbi:hypothetical protein SAMN04487943_101282 [Gracilibacillus orientalis]|uniref:Lipoprotein n=1 Tax=Gracilibacillus orientalis TaxID=334253 RepID=A0A1I4HAK6_9BACI|nr:hypothetical protein [Gracilibacillus orientalis]SFL38461.1 hypothetical protein SAMN04487943_101282 [Gracilibacillus orientalis]
MLVKKVYFFSIILFALLIGCEEKGPVEPETNIYQGEHLTIGVLGETPPIREENVTFHNISLDHLINNSTPELNHIDGIFIIKKYFEEVSQEEYVAFFSETEIPIVFIESEKSFVPFIDKDLKYSDAPTFEDQMYAVGIKNIGNMKYDTWGIGLYNDTKNASNIKRAYSNIFRKIEKVK